VSNFEIGGKGDLEADAQISKVKADVDAKTKAPKGCTYWI